MARATLLLYHSLENGKLNLTMEWPDCDGLKGFESTDESSQTHSHSDRVLSLLGTQVRVLQTRMFYPDMPVHLGMAQNYSASFNLGTVVIFVQ